MKFQRDILNFCDFIQVFVFTTNHHLKGPIFFLFCTAQLVRAVFLYPYWVLSFYEMRPFAGALRNTDHEVSVPKWPGKWLYFINQGQLFQISYINTSQLLLMAVKSALKSGRRLFSFDTVDTNRY